MVSYSIIYRQGLEAYVTAARKAGVAGAIVPDLPAEESAALAEVCRRQDFSLIQLIAPTTPRERALRIAERTSGFIYYVSVTGITGERTELPPEILDNVAWLRGQTPLPICIGFGISRPEHVRMLAPVADGLIVGSAIVRRVAEAVDPAAGGRAARDRRLRRRVARRAGVVKAGNSVCNGPSQRCRVPATLRTTSPPARRQGLETCEIDVVGHGLRGAVGPQELGQVRDGSSRSDSRGFRRAYPGDRPSCVAHEVVALAGAESSPQPQ